MVKLIKKESSEERAVRLEAKAAAKEREAKAREREEEAKKRIRAAKGKLQSNDLFARVFSYNGLMVAVGTFIVIMILNGILCR